MQGNNCAADIVVVVEVEEGCGAVEVHATITHENFETKVNHNNGRLHATTVEDTITRRSTVHLLQATTKTKANSTETTATRTPAESGRPSNRDGARCCSQKKQ